MWTWSSGARARPHLRPVDDVADGAVVIPPVRVVHAVVVAVVHPLRLVPAVIRRADHVARAPSVRPRDGPGDGRPGRPPVVERPDRFLKNSRTVHHLI